MRETPLILAVDDTPENLEILSVRLEANGYEVQTAADGEEGLARARELEPDLILLDIMMPKLDGISVVRELKRDAKLKAIPVILVTAKADTRDIVAGLDAGGDDYLTKPFEHAALLARVRSMLRQKALHDTVQDQARELAEWNTALEGRVAEQVDQIERIGRLRRFLPPQVADLIVASADHEMLLGSHRQEVTVVFCDLRGFTAFAEKAQPDAVMAVLAEYHAALGALILAYEGTLERFLGDGLLVLFNDPMPCPDHAERAVRMALDMQARVGALAEGWRNAGHHLGFGVGIAKGEATLGRIGFDRRLDYAAIGRIPNLASRLCTEAKAGQVLVSEPVFLSVESRVEAAHLGHLVLKGFQDPVPAYAVTRWRAGDAAAA
ncbi:MAG: adenylate/guanylate cyclase domain-containing protein [Microvirga sp.]